jgi:hypothetical protein
LAEKVIEVFVIFSDAAARPLGQFVIAQKKMHSAWKLAGKSRNQIEQLVRLISTAWVAKRSMHEFLDDELTLGIPSQVGAPERLPEVLNVAVQVAKHKYVRFKRKGDDTAAPAGHGSEPLHGLT